MQEETAEIYWLDKTGREWFINPVIAPLAVVKMETFMGARFLIKRSSDQRVVLDHTVGPQQIQLPPGVVCDASQNSGKARPPNTGHLLPTQTVQHNRPWLSPARDQLSHTTMLLPLSSEFVCQLQCEMIECLVWSKVIGLVNLSPCDLVVNWKSAKALRSELGAERWTGDLPDGHLNAHFEYTWIGMHSSSDPYLNSRRFTARVMNVCCIASELCDCSGHEFVVRVRSDNSLVQTLKVGEVEIIPCNRETETIAVEEANKQGEKLQSRQQDYDNLMESENTLEHEIDLAQKTQTSLPVKTNYSVPMMPIVWTGSMNRSWGFPSNVTIGAIAIPDPLTLLLTPMMSVSNSLLNPIS